MPSLTENAGDATWWKEAVFYQIYPLSFADSDGDGRGDLPGVIGKLDYLTNTLGVDAIWLSPFYRSPMRDFGYDVSDHCDVDPLFGTLDDAKRLIGAAHERGLRVIIDYVMNHTSDQHPWFLESRSSSDNSKRDWFVWRDGRDGGPPNNWVSVFSGPAWTFDDETGQWYRHTYLPEQPDLNWRNPEVVEAMVGVLRFWLELGVDGFRVDAAHQMMKDPLERDNPPAPPDYPRPYKDMGEYDHFIHLYDFAHPDVHDIHRRLRQVIDEYPQSAVSIGEIHIFDLPEWAAYYGENFDQLHMPFNFHLLAANWDVPTLRATVESVLWNVPDGGWTNWTLGNHDEIRLATRLPEGHHRLAALLLLTLRGTPFIYYGDELGMRQVTIEGDDAQDPWGFNVDHLSRDGCRTPMRWSPSPNGGFTVDGVSPWLPMGDNLLEINVEAELPDPSSTLNLYRRLIELRKNSVALRRGSYRGIDGDLAGVLGYRREARGEALSVFLNLGQVPTVVDSGRGLVVLSTLDPHRNDRVETAVTLGAGEGLIVRHEEKT